MLKKQSISYLHSNGFFFLAALCIITVCFFLFTPKVSSLVFPFKRDSLFKDFLTSAQKSGAIDPQKFWEFRDFYSPGYFVFSDDGINPNTISSTLDDMSVKPSGIDLYFSKFSSTNSESLDGLTQNSNLANIFKASNINQILFQNSDSVIYKNGDRTFIVFLLPVSEMEKANGLFDYEGKDKDLVKNKYWFDITKLDR